MAPSPSPVQATKLPSGAPSVRAFLHSFRNKCLLSTYNIWGAELGDKCAAVWRMGTVPAFMGVAIYKGEEETKHKQNAGCDHRYESYERRLR